MKPRPIYPGSVYLVTRRTTQGKFLLVPRRKVNECIRFCLAAAQRCSEVEIYAVMFMSNHYHIVLKDVKGHLPAFTAELDRLLALCLNRLYGRHENFWSSAQPPSQVRLATSLDVMSKIVYTLANATEAGLVAYGGDWPGVRLYRVGRYKAKKPKCYFRREDSGGALPDRLYLTVAAPDIGEYQERHKNTDKAIGAAVGLREQALRRTMKRRGRRFVGAATVTSRNICQSPEARRIGGGISPRVASRDRWRRLEMLGQLKEFVTQHKEMRKRFVAGERDVKFPYGTYQMVKRYGACCAPAPG